MKLPLNRLPKGGFNINPAEEYITKWFIAEMTLQIAQKFGVKPLAVIDIILNHIRKEIENEKRTD